jgi:hypothetical protein
MAMHEKVCYADVVRTIRDLVSRRGTATLYVRTDRNRIVIIGVKSGRIVTLSSGPKRGEKAIPILREMSAGAMRVDDSALAYRSEEMPPTPAILAMLVSGRDRRPSAAHRAEPATSDRIMEAEKIRTILCQLLGPHLGPKSPLACEEVVASANGPLDAQGLRNIIDRLAAEIADPAEALKFATEATRQLRL